MKKILKECSGEFISSAVILLLIISNLIIQGITCNDEVQLRLASQHGVWYFLHNQFITEDIREGRILGALGNIKFLSFLSTNIYVFRIIDIIFIFFSVFLLGWYVYKVIGNKWLSILTVLLTLVFMPITFEHSVPNAFVIVVCQPLILLLISLILYELYLEKGKLSALVWSCITFFWACCLYEFVVTYTIAFIVVPIIKNSNFTLNSVKELIKNTKCHVITAMIYLALYLIQARLFPTDYSGTVVDFSEPIKILKVIVVEWMSSIPGYYLINKKYRYLYSIYEPQMDIHIIIFAFIFFGCLCLLVYSLVRRSNAENTLDRKKIRVILLLLFIYTFLPVLPNSITALYQESVSTSFFTSIPVSFFLYFSMMFFLTVFLKLLSEKSKLLGCLCIILTVIIGTSTFVFNSIIAQEQYKNYKRLVDIEEFLSTNFWDYYNDLIIEAPSLYETRNNLAIEDGHWTDYMSLHSNGNIIVDSDNKDAKCFIYMQPDNSFFMVLNDDEYYVSKASYIEPLIIVEGMNRKMCVLSVESGVWKDNGFIFYKVTEEI